MKVSPRDFLDICRDQVETVNTNIRHFLKDKTHTMNFRLEEAQQCWPELWEWIGAEGSYSDSLAEWSVQHNATEPFLKRKARTIEQRLTRAWWALFPR